MSSSRPASLSVRLWVLLVLAMAGLGALGIVLSRSSTPGRVVIIASPLDSQGQDLGPGMAALMTDLLEVLSGATVNHAPAVPSAEDLKRMPPETVLLRFHGGRDGDHLALSLEWTTIAHLFAGRAWTRNAAPAQPPAKTMEHVVQHWPWPVRYRYLDELVPQSPAHFWQLLDGLSVLDDPSAAAHLAASQQLVQDEPGCATAWATLGDHLYRSMWVNPEQTGIGLNSRTHQAFQKAVDLVPGHPRATFLWSMMLTDTGNQSAALRALKEASRIRPGAPDLYLGIAYAGRTSGLLEVARRALVKRKELLGPLASPSSWFAETTYLYLDDKESFAKELARKEAIRQDANLLFYQGYFALLQGQPQQALRLMRLGGDPNRTPTHFRDLCRVYQAYLEGRPEDGLAELRAMDETRGKLRIPDGEWTFKEAEAYSVLGDADRGIDCATRAFVQGFSCATWYEASPFLARVRQHPRWPMLRRNIRERQAVLEGSYPPSSFDP